MKLLVTCDQVFDVLTRGPFPAGHDSDEAVEQHLRACHECRQLAQALQPAVALLHEAIAGEPGGKLPAYQGRLFAERSSTPRVRSLPEMLSAHGFESRPEQRSVLSTNGRNPCAASDRLVSAARCVAAAALVAALTVLAWGLGASLNDSLTPPLAARPAQNQSHQPTSAGVLTLASLQLPEVCFPLAVARARSEIDESGRSMASSYKITRVCCTDCHTASKPNRPAVRSIAKLQQSCSACHESHES